MIQQYHAILQKSVDAGFFLAPVLVPDEYDLQGHRITAEDIEKAAYDYMEQSQLPGVMHQTTAGGVVLVDNTILRADTEISAKVLKKGTWLAGFRVYNQKIREKILDGTFTGVSIGGEGVLIDEQETANAA